MTSEKGFWETLDKPIIGLSPMDGVTDAPFRYMVSKYSKPAVILTEFVNVEGLARGAVSMLKAFRFNEIERPIVAQIYGVETASFYKVALMACFLGFDGIDINMGCPVNKVARRGSGAGMIKIPEHARKVIQTIKQASRDWFNGITLEEAEIRPKIITALQTISNEESKRRLLPVSVKTRIGYDAIETENWINNLVSEKPAAITLHGRTLKQMYSGDSNWNEIAKAARICHEKDVILLGNGDIRDLADARRRSDAYGTDGALVGRATCGNPWFFIGHEPDQKELFQIAIEHARYFEVNHMDHAFFAMRKHLAWYCRGFDGAREMRTRLMQTSSAAEVEAILLHNPPATAKIDSIQ